MLCSRPRYIQGMGVVLEREWVLCSSGNGCSARAGMGIVFEAFARAAVYTGNGCFARAGMGVVFEAFASHF